MERDEEQDQSKFHVLCLMSGSTPRLLPIYNRRTPLHHVSLLTMDTSATVVSWRTPLDLEIQSTHKSQYLVTLN